MPLLNTNAEMEHLNHPKNTLKHEIGEHKSMPGVLLGKNQAGHSNHQKVAGDNEFAWMGDDSEPSEAQQQTEVSASDSTDPTNTMLADQAVEAENMDGLFGGAVLSAATGVPILASTLGLAVLAKNSEESGSNTGDGSEMPKKSEEPLMTEAPPVDQTKDPITEPPPAPVAPLSYSLEAEGPSGYVLANGEKFLGGDLSEQSVTIAGMDFSAPSGGSGGANGGQTADLQLFTVVASPSMMSISVFSNQGSPLDALGSATAELSTETQSLSLQPNNQSYVFGDNSNNIDSPGINLTFSPSSLPTSIGNQALPESSVSPEGL